MIYNLETNLLIVTIVKYGNVILTNLVRCSQEGSPLIMRFFVRIYFEDFLRKTAFFTFSRTFK